jgi:Xaa-Pro aminopeptidase
MITDLDQLMQKHAVDGLLVTGPALQNPEMVYLTGRRHITNADLIKKRGEPAVIFHGPMERDEAAQTGLKAISYSHYPMASLLKQTGGDRTQALVLRYQRMFEEVGLTTGKIMLYGRNEIGPAFSLFSALQDRMPGLTFTGDTKEALLPTARATKDAHEIGAIRNMGRITTQVVAEVADFLTSHAVKDGRLVKSDSQPLRLGEVKNRINLLLAELGAENPEDTIFAIGRDAGVPHSSGNPDDELRLGQTIVFDIYPCEAGGGYYYDFTRTWCLGYAPDEAQALYEQVRTVYDQLSSELTVNTTCAPYQRRTCELFEAQGHPTVLSQPETEQGYVHSLGHGVGLAIHERPWFGSNAGDQDILLPGSVFTLEPGLYYPDQGLGVRLEDTLWVTPDGRIEVLVPYPMDLVLPVH